MFFKYRFYFLLVCAVFALSSCSEYNRLLKSPDIELRYNKAIEYYQKGKYNLAIPLLEDLIPACRGTSKAEWVYYYYSMSQYKLEDYYSAASYLKNFVKTFPKSDLSEECAYLSALCTYNLSPKYSLDQLDTHQAITDFQLFLNRYPESPRRDTINVMMIQLRSKLERKNYEIAKLYFHTEKYAAAVIALENCLKDFPNTSFEESILYMLVKAHFSLAKNSIELKKKERLEQTIKAYQRYIDRYPNNAKLSELESVYKSTIQLLQNT